VSFFSLSLCFYPLHLVLNISSEAELYLLLNSNFSRRKRRKSKHNSTPPSCVFLTFTHRCDRPFSGTREVVPEQWEDQYHPTNDIRYSTAGMDSKLAKTTTVEGESDNAPTVSTQVSAMYYITNFPNRLLYVDLRKGLEVCGILSDVYVSQYCNIHGHRFGFVKFLKVRDVTKLNKALNNVYFGDLRLFANVAKFDRFVKEEERMEDVVGRDQRSSGEGEKKWWDEGRKKTEGDRC